MTVRWARYQGPPAAEEECARIRSGELYKIGDTVLVWVNEGDIIGHGTEMDRPKSPGEIMRDALQWVSNNVGAHPENVRQVVNQALREASASR